MIKIEHYKVNGYKNIKEADLVFNNINVIIGPNNSGKSNFIQSISFLNYIINSSGDELEKHFTNGFFNSQFKEIVPIQSPIKDKSEGIIDFELKFQNTSTNRIFNYGLTITWIYTDFSFKYKIFNEYLDAKEANKPGKPITIFNREKNTVKYSAELGKVSVFDQVPSFFSVVRILKLISKDDFYIDAIQSLNSIIKTPIFYFSNLELLKSENKDRLNVFNGRIVAFELEDEILNLQKNKDKWEIFEKVCESILNIDDIVIVEFSSGKGEVNKKSKKSLYLSHFKNLKSINQLSDGTVLILALITKILSSENDVFFIEEPENSTHPKALIDLFAFIRSFSETKQFIISSHSIALLNKTHINDIIVSCAGKNGLSEFINVSHKKELKKKLNQGHINFSDELFFNNFDDDDFE